MHFTFSDCIAFSYDRVCSVLPQSEINYCVPELKQYESKWNYDLGWRRLLNTSRFFSDSTQGFVVFILFFRTSRNFVVSINLVSMSKRSVQDRFFSRLKWYLTFKTSLLHKEKKIIWVWELLLVVLKILWTSFPGYISGWKHHFLRMLQCGVGIQC